MIKRCMLTNWCVLIIFSIMLCNLSSVAAKQDKLFEKDDSVYEDARMLKEFGIILGDETNTLNLDSNVTRGEMATIALRLMGLSGESVDINEQAFSDIDKNHWLFKNAVIIKKTGIMSGYADGKFGPDDGITYEQAIKTIVCILGYEKAAEQKGGYPSGYILCAHDIKILKNINIAYDSSISRGHLVMMIKNALEVDLMENKSYIGDGEYAVDPSLSLLKKLNIEKIKGKVTATEITALDGYSRVSSGNVRIDEKNFQKGKEQFSIDTQIYAYCKVDDSTPERIIYSKWASSNFKSLDIYSSDITDIKKDSENITLEYIYNKETQAAKTIRVTRKVIQIYNEKYEKNSDVSQDFNDIYSSRTGTFKLFDTDDNGIYDLVYMTKYDVCVVDHVDETNDAVYLKNNDKVLDLNKNSYTDFSLTKNGSAIEISAIKPYDILSVRRSKDLKTIFVEVPELGRNDEQESPTILRGQISSIQYIDDYAIIEIDGKPYETTNEFCDKYKANISPGISAVFYFDTMGQIAFMVMESESYYGYLMNIGTKNSIDQEAQLSIFTDQGKMFSFKAASRVYVYLDDGSGYTKVSIKNGRELALAFSKFDAIARTVNTARQMIKYELNDFGYISKIYAAKDEFEFSCLEATDWGADNQKSFYNRPTFTDDNGTYYGYSENDFFVHEKVKVKIPEERLSVTGNNGYLPIEVSPKENRDDNDISLRRHYINYDVGKYTNDDPDFSFFRMSGTDYTTNSINPNGTFDASSAKRGLIRSVYYPYYDKNSNSYKKDYVFTDPIGGSPGGNIVKFSFGFENGTRNGFYAADCTVDPTTENVATGVYALKVYARNATKPDASFRTDINNYISVGQTYYIKFKMKFKDDITDTVKLKPRLTDMNGTAVWPADIVSNITVNGSTWTEIVGTYTPTTQTTKTEIFIQTSAAALGKDYYIDDFSVEQSGNGPTLPDVKTSNQVVISGTGDLGDALNNLPGRIEKPSTDDVFKENDFALVDAKFLLTSNTKIFMIAGTIDSKGNIFDSNTADVSGYRMITTQDILPNSNYAIQLFDVDKANVVKAMTIIDRNSLGYDIDDSTYFSDNDRTAVLMKSPSTIISDRGESVYKFTVCEAGQEKTLYARTDNTPKDSGHILRLYNSAGELQSANGIDYEFVPPTYPNYYTVPGIDRKPTYINDLKGLYQGAAINKLSMGSAFQYKLDGEGLVTQIRVLFDYQKQKGYYETSFANTFDKFLNPQEMVNKSTNTYASGTIGGLSTSRRMMAWGKAKGIGDISSTYKYLLLNTNLPVFYYYDRVTNGSNYQILYSDENNNPKSFEVERMYSLKVRDLKNIIKVDIKRGTAELVTINSIQQDDEIFIVNGNSTGGACVIFK